MKATVKRIANEPRTMALNEMARDTKKALFGGPKRKKKKK